MIRILSAGLLAACALAACAPTTTTSYHAADAPTVGVATKASPSTSPTLSSGLNTQTAADRASPASPAPSIASGDVMGGTTLAPSPNAGTSASSR